MKVDIKNENFDLKVNTLGAYVECFNYKDKVLFFPKVLTKIDGKLKARGGMHPCVPNFGKDEITNQNQHGFGRDEFWEVIEKSDDEISLKLDGKEDYEGISFEIDYILTENGLTTKLLIRNSSGEEKLVAPGFHPYFYVKDLEIKIKDFHLDKSRLEDTIYLNKDGLEFSANGNDYRIFGDKINMFAIWTDFNGDYICVEPTFNGPSFSKSINNPYKLEDKEDFSFDFKIEKL